MNTNIVITQDARRKKKDGTFPIIFRLSHNGKTMPIPSGFSVKASDWDEKNRAVKKSYTGITSVVRLNNMLQKRRAGMIDILTKLEDKGELRRFAISEVKQRLLTDRQNSSLFSYAQTKIEELIKVNRIGTARSYKETISVLRTYANGHDLAFNDITYQWLTKFETHHLSKGNSPNTLSFYLRALRAIYNKAIKDGIAEKEGFPFADFRIKHAQTKKRAISVDAIKKLLTIKTQLNTPLRLAQDLFAASFYMMGMNFTDLAHLKKSDVVDGRIKYERTKTGHMFDMQIPAPLGFILSTYIKGKQSSDFIFPIIQQGSSMEQYGSIRWAQKRYNARLKELALRAGLEEKLTSYVSRHSFASIAKNKGIPVAAISEMLGHKSISTTQVYLDSLASEVRDQYHESIVNI